MSAHLHLASPAEGVPSRPVSPIQLVLADDHMAVRRSLRRLLEQNDGLLVVAEATDLVAVTRHVRGHIPHVLVLDLELPDGGALDVMRKLRRAVPETEIVVMTMDRSPLFAQ